jgi:hypothetical protein
MLAILGTWAALAACAGADTLLPQGPGQCHSGVFGVPLTSETCAATLINGNAVAPPDAPPKVKAVIAAANHIDRLPYVWGGGHLGWRSSGYDCSGSVSYALHGAGLLGRPLVSGQLTSFGKNGVGRWITIYAHPGHVYMVIAGLLYDTMYDPPGITGPRWHRQMIPSTGFVARHPGGL